MIYTHIYIYIVYTYQRLVGRDDVSSSITARRLPVLQVFSVINS